MRPDAARRRARAAYPDAPAFQGAFMRGWAAGRAGHPMTSCPYGRRRVSGRAAAGWSSAYRAAWVAGWRLAVPHV